mgnify:CR=1 FL=1
MLLNRQWITRILAAAGALVMFTGCSYMSKRGHDALDIFDIGATVNKTAVPQFGLYFDQFTVVGLGYSDVNATFFGICNGRAGAQDYVNQDWQAVAWGSLHDGAEPFNPEDPYQARADQRNLTERPTFDSGFVRLASTDNPPPAMDYTMCRKIVHLGYAGLVLNCHPVELFDFLAGWTTLDFMNDDARKR